MKYKIVITNVDGETIDEIDVIDGASLLIASGEKVAFVDENGVPAKFGYSESGKNTVVRFEDGQAITLVDYQFDTMPATVPNAVMAAELTPGNEPEPKEGESEAQPETVSNYQNDPVSIAFGASSGGGGGEDAANSVVGAISTDPDFTLIRKSSVNFTSHSSDGGAEFSGPTRPGDAPQEQEEVSGPTVLTRQTNTVRTVFARPADPGPQNAPPVAIDDAFGTDEETSILIPILDNDFDPEGDPITTIFIGGKPLVIGVPVTLPSGATVVLNPDLELEYDPGGSFDYVPAGETVVDTFVYSIEDSNGGRDSATVSVDVTGLNDVPVATDDVVEASEDDPATFEVLRNDDDPDGDPLTVVGVSDPPSGAIVTINPDGTISYDPNEKFETLAVGETATDTFTYIIDDGNGGTDTASVTVTVIGKNDPSEANPDDGTIDEDGKTNIPLIDNDKDIDGDELCVGYINGNPVSMGDTVVLPSGAILTINGDGSVDYDTNGQFDGMDEGDLETETFTYSLCEDHDGGTQTSTVTVTITGTNDPPIANPDSSRLNQNETADIPVLTNDEDPDEDDVLSIDSATSVAAGGTTIVNTDGTITFDPDGKYDYLAVGESVAESFSYVISDQSGETASAIVSLIIDGVNDGPDALDDSGTTGSDEAVTIDVLVNDSDPDDSDVLSVANVIQPGSGASVELNPDGTLTYDPGDLFLGLGVGQSATDTFSYVVEDGNGGTDIANVTVTINGVNEPPVAQDDSVTVSEGATSLPIDILDNDSDPNGSDQLSVLNVTDPDNGGEVTLNSDGSLSFDPNDEFEDLAAGESRVTEVTYQIDDGHGQTDSAVVSITVLGENDDPSVADDSASTSENTPVSIDVLANDLDVDTSDTHTVSNVTTPLSGAAVSVNSDQTVDYDPEDKFEYLAAGESETDTFSYTADDGNGGTGTALVTVTVFGENDSPDAIDDTATTGENQSQTIDVLANDLDPDLTDALTISNIDQPNSGAVVTQNSDGTLNYDPNDSFEFLAVGESQTDTFSYSIDDGNGGTDSATVTVTIIGQNDAPVAADDSASTTEEAVVTIDVLANDLDADISNSHEVESVTQPGSGAVVTINSNETVDYDPNGKYNYLAEGESAVDSFRYTMKDSSGVTQTANVTVTVFGENDAPEAEDDSATTGEDSSVVINLLANDFDPDLSDDLTVSVPVQPSSGAGVTVNSDGTVSYDPNGKFEFLANGESATDTFDYVIDDGNGQTDVATATITVIGVNDAPDAIDDAASTTESALVNIDILDNDQDIDASDDHTVTLTQPSGSATASLRSDNTVDYDPNGKYESLALGESAQDTFSYKIDDGFGGTDTAKVTVTVFGENDAPEARDDTASTTEEASIAVDVLENDFDVDSNDNHTVTKLSGQNTVAGVLIDLPSGARISLNNDGDVDYIPNDKFESLGEGQSATDTFTYEMADDKGAVDSAAATITIHGVNDDPDAADDTARTDEESPVTIDVLANDSDIDSGDGLTVTEINGIPLELNTPVGLPGGATVELRSDGKLDYNPAGAFDHVAIGETDTDSFRYTVSDGKGGNIEANVTVTIDGINDPPVAVDDTDFEAREDGPPSSYDITPGTPGQDYDAEGDVFVIGINGVQYADGDVVTLSSGALLTMNTDGNVTYDANHQFDAALDLGETFVETITYTIADEDGATSSATFEVTVIGQNDPPIASDDCSFANTPGDPVMINILANDLDIDGTIDMESLELGAIDMDPDTPGRQSEYIVDGQGVWTADDSGNVTFDPFPTLAGDPDPVYYSVADNHGEFSEPAKIEISFFTSDIWFANDLSGSVDATEYQQGIDLISGVANEIDFGSGEMGNQMGMVSWGGTDQQSLDVPLTSDQTGFIDSVNSDDRSYGAGTLTDIAAAINFSIDTILDPGSGSRQPNGVEQVLTVMTDVHPDQLFNRPPYDRPQYPQDQLANILAAGERAADNGITLVFVAIQDADDPEVLAALGNAAATGPAGPLVFGAGDYGDLGTDAVTGVVEQLRIASVPEEHRDCIAATPVTFDLNGDGVIEYDTMADGFRFDVNGDGSDEQIAWVGNEDAVLIYDHDQDGQISHRSEFVLSDWTREVDTDLEAVATFFDSDQNGMLDSADAEFERFAIWNDGNGNNQVDDGEWRGLLDAGVISLDLQSDGNYSVHAGGEVEVFGSSTAELSNGTILQIDDASFRFAEIDEGNSQPDSGEILISENESNENPIVTTTSNGESISINGGADHDGSVVLAASAPIAEPVGGIEGAAPVPIDEDAAIAAQQSIS